MDILRLFLPALLLMLLVPPRTVALAAQAAVTPPPADAPTASTASAILQPALTNLQQAIDAQHTDKWKASARLRDDTDANIRSIRRDADTVLPPLLAEADASQDSVAAGLPVLRNIEALYDVLLRVALVGRVSAPAPQSAALDQAMAKLDDARRTLGDRLQVVAAAREKQVSDLQAALRAVPTTPALAPVATAAPVPEKKRTPRKKPAPKPAPAAVPAPAPQ